MLLTKHLHWKISLSTSKTVFSNFLDASKVCFLLFCNFRAENKSVAIIQLVSLKVLHTRLGTALFYADSWVYRYFVSLVVCCDAQASHLWPVENDEHYALLCPKQHMSVAHNNRRSVVIYTSLFKVKYSRQDKRVRFEPTQLEHVPWTAHSLFTNTWYSPHHSLCAVIWKCEHSLG